MQVDTVLSRLTALKERIEGTEALIEIDLDHRRNELVAFDLVMPNPIIALFVHTVCTCCMCMLAPNQLLQQHIQQVMMMLPCSCASPQTVYVCIVHFSLLNS